MKTLDNVIATFNHLKPDFYKVYTDFTLLDSKYISTTIKYLDEFYQTINNPKRLKDEFGYPCTKQGQVVIKGLSSSD